MRAIITVLLCFIAGQAFGARFTKRDRDRISDKIDQRLDLDERHQLAAEAFDGMFKFAARQLREEGRPDDARRLTAEWSGTYRNIVLGLNGDVGDHTPFNDWIAIWYSLLEEQLGVEFMEFSHLRDIWVLNFTLPVVFKPHADEQWCMEQLARHPTDTCKREYARHFTGTKYDDEGSDPLDTAPLHHGFSGVVAYWAVWTACEAATWGTGWFVVCMPAGMIIERGTEVLISPRISDKIWDKFNP